MFMKQEKSVHFFVNCGFWYKCGTFVVSFKGWNCMLLSLNFLKQRGIYFVIG